MKAIRVEEFGPPSVLRLREVPDPVPGPGEVLVDLRAAGVNPVDTYMRSGTYPRKPLLPWTPGLDGAGVVEAVGSGVKEVRPDDRVYVAWNLTGTYATKALCTASQVHRLPEKVSFAQGAAIGVPYATAWKALFTCARARPAETVLIHGANGGVGLAAVQMARAAGLRVAGTAGTEAGHELVRREGAHLVLDHGDPRHFQQALEWTGGTGLDIVLEMLANVNLARDLPILARGGRVVVIGSRGTIEIDPRDAMSRDASIVGMVLFNATAAELGEIHAALEAGLEAGTLRPHVGRQMPLAEAPAAHEAVMAPGALGKLVLVP